MSAATLTLDTTPPVVQWGTVAGARPGQVLTVGYELDELEILAAELDAGGLQTQLAIGAQSLSGPVPDSATATATVRVTVRDLVGNQARRELAVQLKQTTFGPSAPGTIDAGEPGTIAGRGDGGHADAGRLGRIDAGRPGSVDRGRGGSTE